MSPLALSLLTIAGSGVVSTGGALLVEFAARRRQRRATTQPAAPAVDPIDEQIAIAAAILAPDSIAADTAALIRQAEAHLRRAAGDTSDIPTIPGDQS